VRISAASFSESARLSASLAFAIERIQLRSAPAENDAPAPVSTTARTSASASSVCKVAVSSAISDSSNALCTPGRSSLTSATAPRMVSATDAVIGSLPPGNADDSGAWVGWWVRNVRINVRAKRISVARRGSGRRCP